MGDINATVTDEDTPRAGDQFFDLGLISVAEITPSLVV
jgi:hypothetical protein